MGYYHDKMEELNADGIAFYPIMISKNLMFKNIIASYTKEEFKNINYFPKTCHSYWKLVDGKKVYLD